ncbi:MAG: hypothetical protein RR549_00090, partial [Oscillospiraceae bacterium]
NPIKKISNGIYKLTFGTPEEISLVSLAENEQSSNLNNLKDCEMPFSTEEISFKTAKRGCVLAFPKKGSEHIYGFGLQ